MAIPRELTDFMLWAKTEIAAIRKWQDDRDENQKWFTRLVIGGVLLAVISNIIGAFFSAAAVVFVVIVNQGKIAEVFANLAH